MSQFETITQIGDAEMSEKAKIAFAAGAMTASLVFFVILGYCGYLLSGFMQRPGSWRLLNSAVALTMFALALAMLRAGGWI